MRPSSTLKIEVMGSYETLVNTYQTTRRHNSSQNFKPSLNKFLLYRYKSTSNLNLRNRLLHANVTRTGDRSPGDLVVYYVSSHCLFPLFCPVFHFSPTCYQMISRG
jgi:hypothetical protein